MPLLKHADVEGKKLTWNLQVIASAVTVKLIWIKAAKPIATIGKVDSQAPKKRHMSPSTLKRNAVTTSPITRHPVKYCKRGSGPHRADLILKVSQRIRITEALEEMYVRAKSVHARTPLL